MRSNQVFMGIPAVSIALGSRGLESLSLYFAMSLVGYHMISIAASQIVLSGGISPRSILNSARKLAANPMVIACLRRNRFSLAGVNEFPRPVDVTLKVLATSGRAWRSSPWERSFFPVRSLHAQENLERCADKTRLFSLQLYGRSFSMAGGLPLWLRCGLLYAPCLLA
jgi:hypothetical protein